MTRTVGRKCRGIIGGWLLAAMGATALTLPSEAEGTWDVFKAQEVVFYLADKTPKSTANTAYLAAPFADIAEARWSIRIVTNFRPTSANLVRMVAVSDNADLSGDFKGYYVECGGLKHGISLYRAKGTSRTMLIDGVEELPEAPVDILVTLTRSARGEWALYCDGRCIGTAEDTAYPTEERLDGGLWTGLMVRYSRSHAMLGFGFANWEVGGQPWVAEPSAEPDPVEPTLTEEKTAHSAIGLVRKTCVPAREEPLEIEVRATGEARVNMAVYTADGAKVATLARERIFAEGTSVVPYEAEGLGVGMYVVNAELYTRGEGLQRWKLPFVVLEP